MAKYELLEPTVDILKISGEQYTLEDGTTQPAKSMLFGDTYFVVQTGEVLTAAQRDAKYRPLV